VIKHYLMFAPAGCLAPFWYSLACICLLDSLSILLLMVVKSLKSYLYL